MLAAELINRKRLGHTHSAEELREWVRGYLAGEIADYQMSAWLMAVCFQGMSAEEMQAWTELNWKSGQSFPRLKSTYRIDKHSTGGVGDKTSLILVPLVHTVLKDQALPRSVVMPMVSGRGLGHTGGTLDKLEAVPGFQTGISLAEGARLCEKNGYVMMGQTSELAPLDKRIYALRDVTGTVASIPLIVGSILGKKLSESLDGLVLDVKFGEGAFMSTLPMARELAKALVSTARACGIDATAILTEMSEPLGNKVGNALEVEECAAYLRGEPPDAGLHEVTLALAGEMIALGSQGKLIPEEASELCEKVRQSGRAFAEFQKMFTAQGADWMKFESGLSSEKAKLARFEFSAPDSGYLARISARELGNLLVEIGGGRRLSTDRVHFHVGFEVLAKVGEPVKQGQPLLRVLHDPNRPVDEIASKLARMISISSTPVAKTKWVEEKI